MFQGSMSSGALSVIESSLSVRLTSGENSSTAAGRLCGVHADAMEYGAHQTTTTRIAGEDQPFGCETLGNQVAGHGEDIIRGRRKRELGRQPVVSSKNGAPGHSRQVCQEQRVHAR